MLRLKQKVSRKITNVGLIANKRGRKPSGSEATESRRTLRRSLKKSNEGVDLGSKRSETLFIYILYICLIIYLTPQQTLESQGFASFMGVEMSVYGCRNVGLWV